MRLYTTILKKQTRAKQKRRRRLLVFLTFILLASLGIQSLALSPNTPKEEVIYVNLNRNGSVDAIYVVNSFELDQDGRIIDYGDYTAFREMTSSGKILMENETVTIDAKAGKLYYQGMLRNSAIPWIFEIRYFLNGKEYAGDQIAGKSGALEISMSVRQNPEPPDSFFRHYTLQAAFKLDTALCRNIRAEGATLANSGRDKQILFTILPGKETDISIKADVRDFEMEGISINGITMNMDFDFEDDPSMTKKLRDLSDGVRKLDEGAVDLRDGAKELSEGVGDLESGVAELKDGAQKLADGTAKLQDGAKELTDGVKTLDKGVKELSEGTEELTDGTKELSSGAKKLLSGANELYNGMTSLSGGLSQLSAQNDALTGGAGQILDSMLAAANPGLEASGLINSPLTKENCGEMIEGILEGIGGFALQEAMEQAESLITEEITASVLEQVKATNPELGEDAIAAIMASEEIQAQIAMAVSQQLDLQREEIMQSVQGELSADPNYAALLSIKGYSDFYNGLYAYTEGVSQSAAGASELAGGMRDWRSGMAKLRSGSIELRDGTIEIHEGVIEMKDGTSKLLDGVLELEDGSVKLNDGMIELKDGVVELLSGAVELRDGTLEFHEGAVTLAEGTMEFRDKTSTIEKDMKDMIKKKIEEMLGGNFKPISFVSEKNTDVLSVQFAMQTEGIKIPEAESPPAPPEKDLSFFDRLLALFRF